MKSSRLVKILEKLSKKELREFSKFLKSPFFNTRSDLIQLYEVIGKDLHGAPESLQKEKVFAKLFPEREYDTTQFNLLRSYLQKLLEQYLSVAQFLDSPFGKSQNLIAAFRQMNLPTDTERAIKTTQSSIKKQPVRNEEFWEAQLRLEWESYFLNYEARPNETVDWNQISTTTDIVYFSKKLRIAVLAKAQEKVLNEPMYDSHLLEDILAKAEKEPFKSLSSIQVYLSCYRMLIESDEPHFLKFKSQLFEHGDKFPNEEIRDLYLLAINFCIRQVNDGAWDRRYFEEVLNLYKEGLEKEYLLQQGILSRFTYHNVVTAALKIEDYKWVEWFMEVYKNFLKKPFRESSFSFNASRLSYSKSQFDEALLLLQSSNYRDVPLNLAARIIKLKIYFETDEWDALSSHLEATRVYLRRKKVIGYHRKFYENLIRYTQKLMALNFYDKAAKERLRLQIEGEEFLTEKEWFYGQLA